MPIANVAAARLSGGEQRSQLSRAVIASTRHRTRVVRLSALRADDRTGYSEAVFSIIGSGDWHPEGVSSFCRGVHCTSHRRGDLRALWRSHRPTSRDDYDVAIDRPIDLSGRLRPHLRADRRLRPNRDGRAANNSGHRRRRASGVVRLCFRWNGRALALYIFGCAVVSIAAVAALPGARHSESEETGSH